MKDLSFIVAITSQRIHTSTIFATPGIVRRLFNGRRTRKVRIALILGTIGRRDMKDVQTMMKSSQFQ